MAAGSFAFVLISMYFLRIIQATRGNPSKFVIISTPRHGQISYMRVSGSNLRQGPPEIRPLISSGLIHPQGLAIDQRRSRLYVADPDSKSVFAYPLKATETDLIAKERFVCAEGTEVRWVSVDDRGNVLFTDEPENKIYKIPVGEIMAGPNKSAAVLYDGNRFSTVSAPGGITTDGFNAFWVNKQTGTLAGSLVQAPMMPVPRGEEKTKVRMLSTNTDKSYGVCLTPGNIFFTQPGQRLYGMRKPYSNLEDSQVRTVSDHLVNPRGCAWDGDGTVYVADRGANAVYSFAANMRELSAVELDKVVDFEDAFGIGVYSAAHVESPVTAMASILVVLFIVKT